MTRKNTKSLNLKEVIYEWRLHLQGLASSGELIKASKQALYLDEIPKSLTNIVTAIKGQKWSLLPSIKLLSSKEIGAARAAWDDGNSKIYINKEWLKNSRIDGISSLSVSNKSSTFFNSCKFTSKIELLISGLIVNSFFHFFTI